MKYYRLTKYDPKYRDSQGIYKRDEWTYFAQIGENFPEGKLTLKEYEKVENNYLLCIEAVLESVGIRKMQLVHLAKHAGSRGVKVPLVPRKNYDIDGILVVIKGILRDCFHAEFKTYEGYFIHFGWDYYVYLGLPKTSLNLKNIATRYGLFLEDCRSPYLERD